MVTEKQFLEAVEIVKKYKQQIITISDEIIKPDLLHFTLSQFVKWLMESPDATRYRIHIKILNLLRSAIGEGYFNNDDPFLDPDMLVKDFLKTKALQIPGFGHECWRIMQLMITDSK